MIGKYVELWTIWKAHVPDDQTVGPVGMERGLSTGKWVPRPVGILFRKQQYKEAWIFLVLVAPISYKDDPDIKGSEGYKFYYREGAHRSKKYEWQQTSETLGGIPKYVATAHENAVENSAAHIGDGFLYEILRDVLWGWERYIAAIRNDIRAVLVTLWSEI